MTAPVPHTGAPTSSRVQPAAAADLPAPRVGGGTYEAHWRQIDVTGLTPVAAATTERVPSLMWVAIEDIVIDDRYQRPLLDENRAAIQRIAAAFTWDRFSPVVIARAAAGAPGCYALIDGQHRTHAAALAGHIDVPAWLVDLDAAGQAAAFAGINGDTTRVNPQQVFRAALAAGEAWAIDCDRIVREAGCSLMTAALPAAQRAPGQIYAIALVRRMVEAGQGALLQTTLRALGASEQGRAHAFVWDAAIVQALLAAVEGLTGTTQGQITRWLDSINLQRMREGAARLRQSPNYAGRSTVSLLTDILVANFERWRQQQREAS